MLDLLWRACFRWRLRPHHATGDGKYGNLESIPTLGEAAVRAYVALHESGDRPGFFPKGAFRYDVQEDACVCPAGKLLRPLGNKKSGEQGDDLPGEGLRVRGVPVRATVHHKKNGRQIRRSPGERHVDRGRGYRQTEPYRRAIRKRKVWVEPSFAEGKAWHGGRGGASA